MKKKMLRLFIVNCAFLVIIWFINFSFCFVNFSIFFSISFFQFSSFSFFFANQWFAFSFSSIARSIDSSKFEHNWSLIVRYLRLYECISNYDVIVSNQQSHFFSLFDANKNDVIATLDFFEFAHDDLCSSSKTFWKLMIYQRCRIVYASKHISHDRNLNRDA